MDPIGSITLIELLGICEVQGRYGLPHPFWRTQPAAAPVTNTAVVADRYDSGDLRVFKPWAQAYVRADIWVECRVNFTSDDPDLRILAYRAGESGFLASQRPGEDVVDVYELSPYELGTAVAGSAELVGPGAHSAIVIPGYWTDSVHLPPGPLSPVMTTNTRRSCRFVPRLNVVANRCSRPATSRP